MGGMSTAIYRSPPAATDLRPHAGADLGRQAALRCSAGIVLFKPGPGQFIPIGVEEFGYVEQGRRGTYPYNLVEYQRFSIRNYKNWIATLDPNQRF
jgi:hypothetical protein